MTSRRPHYDPPYESPLEDLFAWDIVKYLDDSVEFNKQVEVMTLCGRFRLDFVAAGGEKRIAFECDGAEYHDSLRDEWRDAMILGATAVDVIYRLRGRDLFFNMEDCLFLVARRDPEVLDERGLMNLAALASPAAHSYQPGRPTESVSLTYGQPAEGADRIRPSIFVERRAVDDAVRVYWRECFAFAKQNGGGNLDRLMLKHSPWLAKP